MMRFVSLFQSLSDGRRTQGDKPPRLFDNALVFDNEGGTMLMNVGCEDDCRGSQKGQREELAQHAVERTGGRRADVVGMVLMVHTLLATMGRLKTDRVDVEGRQNQHWQEDCQ